MSEIPITSILAIVASVVGLVMSLAQTILMSIQKKKISLTVKGITITTTNSKLSEEDIRAIISALAAKESELGSDGASNDKP